MYSFARHHHGSAWITLSAISLFVHGCGSMSADNPAGNGAGAGADSVSTASDTLFSTIETPDFGRYDLVARGPDDASGNWQFAVRSGRGAPAKDELRFVWDFGDGKTYEGVEQSYSFTTNGSYVIRVTAIKLDGTVAFVLTLNVQVAIAGNEPPIADAGTNQTADANTLVFLYGGASTDPDGDPLTYKWVQVSGTPVLLLHASEPTASFITPSIPQDSDLVFRMTVNDGQYDAQATAVVRVLKLVQPAQTLVVTADAGADQSGVLEGTAVALDGSGSSVSDGSPLAYAWSQTSGPTVTLSNAQQATASFTAPLIAVGTSAELMFELVVTAGDQSASDSVRVVVVQDPLSGGGPPHVVDPCTADSDGDGVMDCNDLCPGEDDRIDSNVDGIPDCLQRLAPVALFHFEGNVLDASGNATGGGWSGAGSYATDGAVGRAASFDGTNYVTLADASGLAVTEHLTVAAWVRFDTLAPAAAYSTILDTTVGTVPRNGYSIFYRKGDGVIRAELWNAGQVAFAIDSSSGGWQANTWYHIAVVFDSQRRLESGHAGRWYVDGQVDSSSTWGGGVLGGIAPTAAIGRLFVGDLDELAVWDRGLTQAEVQALVAAGSPGTHPPPSLVVSPAAIDFGNSASTLTFGVSASGGVLSYTIVGNANWLTVTPASGSSSGEVDTITATATRTGLASGPYASQIVITPTGGGAAITVAVAMTVAAVATPVTSVSPLSLDFGSTATSLTFEVWNSGTGTLTYSLSDDSTWLSVSPTSGTSTGEHDTITATANRASLPAGSYTSRITVTPTGGGSPVTVGLAMTVAAAATPSLAVAPLSLDFASTTTSLTFQVWNGGTGTLNFTIMENISWLTCTPTSGSSTGEHDTIACTVDRSGLSAGSYGPAPISVSGASTTTNINVTMSVSAGGALPMSTASRTTGVAPLAVFFDAVDVDGWVSGVVQPPLVDNRREYADFYYLWNFGDPTAGTWATSGRSKNEATGYIAAHVYERFGTYTTTLRVITTTTCTSDSACSGGTCDTRFGLCAYDYAQNVVVTDPDVVFAGRTFYVSSSGLDTNNGLSPTAPFKTFDKAMTMLAPTTRILFKRGDTFSTSSGATINVVGPGIVGAYGTCSSPDERGMCSNAPLINATGSQAFGFSGSTVPRNWRIADVRLQGAGAGIAINGGNGTQRDWLVLRVKAQNYEYALLTNTWFSNNPPSSTYNPATMHDHTMIVDCELANTTNKVAFIGGTRMAVMGTHLHDSSTSHVLRIWYGPKSVTMSNNMHGAGGGLHVLKLHNGAAGNVLPTARYIVVSDNTLGGAGAWPVAIGPQDDYQDERINDLLVERNHFWSDSATQVAFRLWTSFATVRNNVFTGNGATAGYTGIFIAQRGAEPVPVGNRVWHNTFYRSDPGSSFTAVEVSSVAQNTRVQSNLVSAPGTPLALVVNGGGIGGLFDHNLLTLDPRFSNPLGGIFTLQAGSPAIDAGSDVSVLLDADGRMRFDEPSTPNTGSGARRFVDIGAYEYGGQLP